MANVLAELFQNTANAIREKTGETGTMKPADFPEKIRAIQTGGAEAELIPLTVTKNGTYCPADYPMETVEIGKTYAFKESYTQAELQALYNASLFVESNTAELVSNADEGVAIVDEGGIYIVKCRLSGIDYLYLPKEFIAAVGREMAEGWYMESDSTSVKNLTFPLREDMTVYTNGLSALNPLFELKTYYGFSDVIVNVPPSASGKILIQADITKNGVYSPTPDLKVGYTYTFKNEYAQAELKEFYDMSMSKQTNNGVEFAVLMLSPNNMVAIISYSDFYGIGTGGGIWIPEEIATTMNYTKGWNEGADLTSLTPTTTPVLTVEDGYELTFDGVLEDLNTLFELPLADGYSEVSVNVPTTEQVEKTVSPDFSNGDMEVIPDDGKAFSKVTISKPETLIPGNIAEGINIAGIIGTLAGGADYGTGNFKQASGTYTATTTGKMTITHNLGVKPDIIIVANNQKPINTTNNTIFVAGYSEDVAGGKREDFVYGGNAGGLMASFGAEYSIYDSSNYFGLIFGANATTFSIGGALCKHIVGDEYIWFVSGRV